MANYSNLNLIGKRPSASFQYFMLQSASVVTNGVGNEITAIVNLSASYATSASYDFTSSFIQRHFSQLYVDSDGGISQSFVNGTTYTQLTASMTSSISGVGSFVTAIPSSASILLSKPGHYHINGNISCASTTTNAQIKVVTFLSGSEQHHIHSSTKIGTPGDIQSVTVGGIIYNPSSSAYVDVRIRHAGGSPIILIVYYANLNVTYLT